MSWFKRDKADDDKLPKLNDKERKVRTEGLWQKCEGCRQIIWKKDLENNWNVCPKCGVHFRIDAVTRLKLLLDDGVYTRHDTDLRSTDPLGFVDSKPYSERLQSMQQATNLTDALIAAAGRLDGRPVQICAMEPKFIGGSMGSVVGEKITRAIERCIDHRQPLVIVSASGGARMQEGAVSLMQMAKISAGLMRLDEARLPVHQHPHRPDHRRRHRQLRHAGRSEHRRTGRADRLRRTARDRADHPPETARGLPAQRIPAQARHAGCRGAAPGAEAIHRHGAALLCGLSMPIRKGTGVSGNRSLTGCPRAGEAGEPACATTQTHDLFWWRRRFRLCVELFPSFSGSGN